jgi:hypothetical protein
MASAKSAASFLGARPAFDTSAMVFTVRAPSRARQVVTQAAFSRASVRCAA